MTSTDPGRRMHDVIADVVREANPGTIVTGYAIAIEATDGSDTTSFIYDAAEGQSVASTIGLLDLARRYHLARVGDAE